MKSKTSFLFRFPGIFIGTAIAVIYTTVETWHQTDERWWAIPVIGIVFTALFNFYLFFGHLGISNPDRFRKPGFWISMILMLLVTVCTIGTYVTFNPKHTVLQPTDYFLQYATVKAMLAIIIWAWIGLLWNLTLGTSFEQIEDGSPTKKIHRHFPEGARG